MVKHAGHTLVSAAVILALNVYQPAVDFCDRSMFEGTLVFSVAVL